MVNHPDILILDEPCSGLDMPARDDLLNAPEKLAGTGTGIIMVTHHPEDRISPDPFHDHRDTLSPADAEGGQT